MLCSSTLNTPDRDTCCLGKHITPLFILPEVNALQVAHSRQSAQVQTLHPVSGHGQSVHGGQPLQHSGDVGEVVERQAQTVELGQATHLIRQEAKVVSIQRQRLQATRWRTGNNCASVVWLQNIHMAGKTLNSHWNIVLLLQFNKRA